MNYMKKPAMIYFWLKYELGEPGIVFLCDGRNLPYVTHEEFLEKTDTPIQIPTTIKNDLKVLVFEFVGHWWPTQSPMPVFNFEIVAIKDIDKDGKVVE